jgi:hypothetical protein
MTPNLLNSLALQFLGASIAAAAATDADSIIIDMAGYEGVFVMAHVTDSLATGVATLTAQQSATNVGGDMADIAGATASLTSAVDDDLNGQMIAIDVHCPRERYVRFNRSSSVANVAFGDLVVVRYGARKLPIERPSTFGVEVAVSSPPNV